MRLGSRKLWCVFIRVCACAVCLRWTLFSCGGISRNAPGSNQWRKSLSGLRFVESLSPSEFSEERVCLILGVCLVLLFWQISGSVSVVKFRLTLQWMMLHSRPRNVPLFLVHFSTPLSGTEKRMVSRSEQLDGGFGVNPSWKLFRLIGFR